MYSTTYHYVYLTHQLYSTTYHCVYLLSHFSTFRHLYLYFPHQLYSTKHFYVFSTHQFNERDQIILCFYPHFCSPSPLPQNSDIGTSVFELEAVDNDKGPNGEIRYSIERLPNSDRDGSGKFTVDPITGLIRTKSDDLNAESQEKYEVRFMPERFNNTDFNFFKRHAHNGLL